MTGLFVPGGTEPGSAVVLGGVELTVPLLYSTYHSFAGVFSASATSIGERLPSPRLHPVSVGRDRGAVLVLASDFRHVTDARGTVLPPYGELGVMAVVTFGDGPAPPFLPLLGPAYPARWRRAAVALHLLVTTDIARDAGRVLWGFPKILAGVKFGNSRRHHRVEVTSHGREALALTVPVRGPARPSRRSELVYSQLDGRLLRTAAEVAGVQRTAWGPSTAHLDLGDAALADDLRSLGLSTRAIAGYSQQAHSMVLPPPDVAG